MLNFDAFFFLFVLTSSNANNLSELSTLGHFLKGSSASLGLEKVQASCEKIQHYGDKVAEKDLEPEEIKTQLAQLREEYLEDWFRDHEGEH